jgi:hypothetical protein
VTEVAFGDMTVGVQSATDSMVVVTVPEVTFDENATSKAVLISVTNTVGNKSGQIAFTVAAPPPAAKPAEEEASAAAQRDGHPPEPAATPGGSS